MRGSNRGRKIDLLDEEDPGALESNASSSGPPRSRGMYSEMQEMAYRRRWCARCRCPRRLCVDYQRRQ